MKPASGGSNPSSGGSRGDLGGGIPPVFTQVRVRFQHLGGIGGIFLWVLRITSSCLCLPHVMYVFVLVLRRAAI